MYFPIEWGMEMKYDESIEQASKQINDQVKAEGQTKNIVFGHDVSIIYIIIN